MAKFRQNHSKSGTFKGLSGVRIILIVAVLAGILWYLFRMMQNIPFASSAEEPMEQIAVFDFSKEMEDSTASDYPFIPAGSTGEIVHHKHYSLSYVERYEIAEWVAYPLTKQLIRLPNVPRAKRFEDDPAVSTGSATYYDYSGSGYSRGHLAAAADMAFSTEAMAESFFMSNMTPQLSGFNGGIWNELENLVRDWAYKYEDIYVATGPVLKSDLTEVIGKNKVAVPKQFYKVILDLQGPELKAIGFILDHEKSDERLQNFAVTVDEVERLTGLDFFTYLLSENEEARLESTVSVSDWQFDEALYRKRVDVWNNR